MKRSLVSRILVGLSLPVVALGLVGVLALAPSETASAAINPWTAITEGWEAAGGDNQAPSLTDYIQLIINALLFIIGALAVIMIIVGGIRYVTSGGDSNAATSARNTIMYAVVGLLIAAIAYAIVNFVISMLD